jgi:serine protease Do
MRNWTWLAVGLAMAATSARSADEKTLQNVIAPAPAAASSLPAGHTARAVKLVRVVVQLKPEPWALVTLGGHPEGDVLVPQASRLVSWQQGQEEVRASTFSDIFADEFRQAGGAANQNADSLFSEGSAADLQLAVKITEMEGRFCRGCGWHVSNKWTGAVVMTARWELYSSLDRKVVAAVETSGGFTAPKAGLDGEPDRLINEAFRDNIRRLFASEDFRRVVTATAGPVAPGSLTPSIALAALRTQRSVGEAPKSVAVVFAAEGSGSGFLISDDGLLLTNDHVVAGSKYVKLKWSDGAESLGEVVRTDRRRDVALVRADAKGRLPLALRTGEANQGETVYAIGSPLGEALQNTMTKGIVSANRVQGGQAFIQSDVAVTHGNSGGPLLDEKGQVIGITDWGIGSDSGNLNLNFFIPIGDALRALGLTAAPAAAPVQAAAAPPARAARKR